MNQPGQRETGAHRLGRRFFVYGAGVYLAFLLALASFAGGLYLGAGPKGTGQVRDKNAPPSYLTDDVDFKQFWDVWERVREQYVRQPVAEPQLFYGAIRGIVSSLEDPYSSYFDPDESAEFARELQGTFEGIGAEIGFKESQMIVVAPLPQSPAEKTGLRAGDQIIAINDEDTTGKALDVAVRKIRGPQGTTVTLSIYREGLREPKDYTITRAEITVDSVRFKMVDAKGEDVTSGGTFAVIDLSQFNEDTVKEFDAAVREAMLKGAKGVVLDLRNDPGGYLDAAIEVAGGWIDHQTAVIERGFDGKETVYAPSRAASLNGMPTVVLVNKGSASASEIVAGALQDYGYATIVGETSFGKGSVQRYEELPDGSALKLTVALWFTPKNRSIDKHGIEPDVPVELTDADVDAGKDPQYEKAIQILSEKTGTN